MELPDGRPLIVDDGVLLEPIGAGGRIVLWLPAEPAGGDRHWERVGTVAGAAVGATPGIRSVPATSVRARQRVGSGLGGLLRRIAGPRGDRALTIPGGGSAEPCGPRRTDLVLAWPGGGPDPLDESRVRARWPECHEVRRIGRDLFLVWGVDPTRTVGKAGSPPSASTRQFAEEALAAARRAGDPRREVTALTDLGLALLLEGATVQAEVTFEGALAGARRLGDRACEADASSNLAWAAILLGRPDRARDAVGPALSHAREVGDRYAEKLALERLGLAYGGLGDHTRALDCLDQAVAIAREVGDRQHEAALLWREAIGHAELGRDDRAAARAQESVDLFRRLGKPQAEWYARHAAAYRPAPRPVPDRAGLHLGGAIDTSTVATRPDPPPHAAPETSGPGVLRMAVAATQAMAKFVGSGLKAATPEARRARLAACAGCEHHTGLRCRVCGCITAAKARMAHEDCPAGKWPR